MIRVVAEQKDFFVVYKPAGEDFHTARGTPGFFVKLRRILPGEDLFPVHRLDKITSGPVLIARSKEAAAGLTGLFSERAVEKYYLALSDKKPAKKQGLIKGDMVRSRRGSWKLTRKTADPAVSSFYSRTLRPGLRLFLFRIYTGKTHQIRAAMKSLGSPVLGDPVYYASGPASDRGYLHAWQIRFSWKDQDFRFRCDPEEGLLFREELALPADWGCPEALRWPVFR